MQTRIVDSCSLLNFYTGWGGLTELAEFDLSWCVSQSVCKESQYVRDTGKDEKVITVPVVLDRIIEEKLLAKLTVESEQEFIDYVEFAMEIDDGEAESLALARNRELILVTDDKKTHNIADRLGISAQIMTTPEVLKAWSELSQQNQARLNQVINRIQYLARFHPPRNSPYWDWWESNRS